MAAPGPVNGPYPPPPHVPGQAMPGPWGHRPSGPGPSGPGPWGRAPGAGGHGPNPAAGWSAPGSEPAGDASRRGASRRPAGRPAASTAVVPLRPLSVSETLDGAFETMRTNPGATFGIALVAGAVIETFGAIIALAARDASFASYVLLEIVLRGLDLTLVILLAGVLAVVVAEAGQSRITLAAALRRVTPRLPGLVGLSLLLAVLVAVGLVTLGVVSAWLGVLFCFATPVYALEGGTVTGALRRSRYLIRGAWWRTFGILLLAGVVAGALSLVVSVPAALFAAPASSSASDSSGTSALDIVIQALGSLLVVTIVAPVLAGVIAVLYIDRRIRREALDVTLAQAAAVGAPSPASGRGGPPAPGRGGPPAPGRVGWS